MRNKAFSHSYVLLFVYFYFSLVIFFFSTSISFRISPLSTLLLPKFTLEIRVVQGCLSRIVYSVALYTITLLVYWSRQAIICYSVGFIFCSKAITISVTNDITIIKSAALIVMEYTRKFLLLYCTLPEAINSKSYKYTACSVTMP